MARKTLSFEVTDCTLRENGDVLISSIRGRGILTIILGLPIALVSLWMLTVESGDHCATGLFGLALGGALVYVGIRALTAPEILIDTDNRLVRVGKSGSASTQTSSFDALKDMENQPVRVTITELGFSLVRASLYFDDGKSLLLFATADKKKAQEVIQWLQAAFAK